MKIHRSIAYFLAFFSFSLGICSSQAQSSAFNYQGYLSTAGQPANGSYEIQVGLYDSAAGGSTLGTFGATGVLVTNGVFNLALDFGGNQFSGADRWLEIGVRTNGSVEAYTTLLPRQPVTRQPYAIFANTAGSAVQLQSGGAIAVRLQPSGLAGYGPNLVGGSPGNSISAWAGGSTILGGGTTSYPNFIESLDSVIGGGFDNHVLGGADESFIGTAVVSLIGSNAANAFIGGGSFQEIQASGGVVVGGRSGKIDAGSLYAFIGAGDNNRIQTNSVSSSILGGNGNVISNEVSAAVVGGGFFNRIGDDANWAGIFGGRGNWIGSGASQAFLGGGYQNIISNSATYSAIGGGYHNSIMKSSQAGFIGGGAENLIGPSTYAATVGGGVGNTNQGYSATIPGGYDNSALGQFSFASGTHARALHDGAFVWSDSQNSEFNSANNNEFAVRAKGGVRMETSGAGMKVDGAKVLTGIIEAGDLADGSITAAKIAPGAVDAGRIATGSVVRSVNGLRDSLILEAGEGFKLATNGNTLTLSTGGWQLNGNQAGSNSFLGTLDNSPLNLRVGNRVGLRLTPGNDPGYLDFPNVLSGSSLSAVGAGVSGATLLGGGSSLLFSAFIGSSFATVAGGFGNRIYTNSAASVVAGGFANQIASNSSYSVIGGGIGNMINAMVGTISGGADNNVGTGGQGAFIGGGRANLANTTNSAVLGGSYNQIGFGGFGSVINGGTSNQILASLNATILAGDNNIIYLGNDSAILGGTSNVVAAAGSVAAGTQARALHSGSFVWADPSPNPLESTAPNQFVARSIGGVRFITSLGTPDVVTYSYFTKYDYVEVPAGTPGAVEHYRCEDAIYTDYDCGFDASIPPASPISPILTGKPKDFSLNLGWHNPWGSSGGGGDASSGDPRTPGRQPGEYIISTNYVLITATNIYTTTNHGGFSAPAGVKLDPGAGSWSSLSDRNAKANFSPVDGAEILEKIAALPITSWNYRSQPESIRHLGPVAQDFRAAFHLGSDDTTITTTDEEGVALAAIKGLNQKVEEQAREAKAKDAKIISLENRLAELEKLINAKLSKPN